MTCCAHKIIVASIPSRILPLPPGFTHFPTIPAPTGFERPFERRDHGKVENPPPPRIPLKGESGSPDRPAPLPSIPPKAECARFAFTARHGKLSFGF